MTDPRSPTVSPTPMTEEKIAEQGGEPIGETPDKFAAFIQAETAKWAKVVKDSGASVD